MFKDIEIGRHKANFQHELETTPFLIFFIFGSDLFIIEKHNFFKLISI